MLTQSSNIFQRIAIGWEQMDYEKTDSVYKDHFTSAKFRMKTVRFSNKIHFSLLLIPNDLSSVSSDVVPIGWIFG